VISPLEDIKKSPLAYSNDEGLIAIIEGSQGAGKTSGAIAMGYEDFQATGKKVISNNHLNEEYFTNFKHMTLDYILTHISGPELEDIILIWDEAQKEINASARTRESRDLIFLIEEVRKRRIQLYMTTQRLKKIDGWAREMIDIRGIARTDTEKPCKRCAGMGLYRNLICPRCLGYGKLSYTQITFKRISTKTHIMVAGNELHLKGKSTFTIGPFRANDYWCLFQTRERMAAQARHYENLQTAEVV